MSGHYWQMHVLPVVIIIVYIYTLLYLLLDHIPDVAQFQWFIVPPLISLRGDVIRSRQSLRAQIKFRLQALFLLLARLFLVMNC